jgi:hypothetical protein
MLSILCTYLPISVIMCLEAIESGHLPADILDDIPAKYVDGALICEVNLIYFWHALLLKATFKFQSIVLLKNLIFLRLHKFSTGI